MKVIQGYFGIGIERCKREHNIGTLWRTAHSLGASFVFTVGRRYDHQSSDTSKAWRHIPLYHHDTLDDMFGTIPHGCQVIGVEYPHTEAQSLITFCHPERAIYLLGAEDHGLTKKALSRCHKIVQIPCTICLNVATSGSIIMYDRMAKAKQ